MTQPVPDPVSPTLDAAAPWAVYWHVPFCVKRCHYCDFATDALAFKPDERQTRTDAYLEAARRELADSPSRPARTVFFGGGTPTTLPAETLAELLAAIDAHHGLLPGAEVSIEANPTTAEAGKFRAIREAGFNRLSLGVQSFNDGLLAALGRVHSVADAERAYRLARQAGFENVSVDLMFALPTQDLRDWRAALDRAIDLAPEHCALYGLTVEPGTPLEKQVTTGRVRLVDPDLEADMYELAIERLGEAGYEQYEISNFAKPGRRCEHNQVYWRNEEYRGYGPGAASYAGRRRWLNVASTDEYVRRLGHAATSEDSFETCDAAGERRETMYLGLRMIDGVDSARFAARYGGPPETWFAEPLDRLTSQGLVERTTDGWRLTRQGVMLSNRVFMEFVG